jgi:hypothetical protein
MSALANTSVTRTSNFRLCRDRVVRTIDNEMDVSTSFAPLYHLSAKMEVSFSTRPTARFEHANPHAASGRPISRSNHTGEASL